MENGKLTPLNSETGIRADKIVYFRDFGKRIEVVMEGGHSMTIDGDRVEPLRHAISKQIDHYTNTTTGTEDNSEAVDADFVEIPMVSDAPEDIIEDLEAMADMLEDTGLPENICADYPTCLSVSKEEKDCIPGGLHCYRTHDTPSIDTTPEADAEIEERQTEENEVEFGH